MRFFYITLLIIGATLVVPDFAFAETPQLPSECPDTIGDYNVVDISTGGTPGNESDFIFVGNSNEIDISGGNGNDCILVGENNTGSISGVNGEDVLIIGNSNRGLISGDGENGDDKILVGDNNSGDVFGGNGADVINIGKDNQGNIFGENDDDDITIDCGNLGTVDESFKKIPCLPKADISPGTYTKVQSVSLVSEDSENLYYTIDGTTPACLPVLGTLYELSILVSSTKTITAVGCSEDDLASDIATFTYTIELKTDSAELSSVLEVVFIPASGASLSFTPSLTVSQDLEINTTAFGSKIVLDQGTVITRADVQEFNVASLSSSEISVDSLLGLTAGKVFEGALRWGIQNITLEFSQPITIDIFVGIDLNGQTLDVLRSTDGSNWETEGLVDIICVVSDGVCSFRATKASYYVATSGSATPSPTPTPTPTPSVNSSAGSVGLQFVNSGAGTLPTENPVIEIILTPTPVATPNIIPTPKPKTYPKIAKASPTKVSTPISATQNQPVEVVSQQILQKATILATISRAIISSVEKVKFSFFGLWILFSGQL